MKRLFLLLIRAYQRFISPGLAAPLPLRAHLLRLRRAGDPRARPRRGHDRRRLAPAPLQPAQQRRPRPHFGSSSPSAKRTSRRWSGSARRPRSEATTPTDCVTPTTDDAHIPVANVLQPLIDVATSVLLFLHNNAGFGWGVSIIALTFITRLLILPLSIKQLRSVRSMQVHAPQIKEIQQKYKSDRQRMQQELMKFYQDNKINPFASCIPLILQFPFFITLFYVLRHDLKPHLHETALHHGNVGWWFIPDLGTKSHGAVLIVLITVYFLTMLGSSLVMAAGADKQQRTMMFIMPVIFTPIIIGFPAGLVLYWIATNIWTIGQQYAIQRADAGAQGVGVGGQGDAATERSGRSKPPPPPGAKSEKDGVERDDGREGPTGRARVRVRS